MKAWLLYTFMRFKYMGRVFVEWWDGTAWNLSAIPWYAYLFGRATGVIGSANEVLHEHDFRHVPKNSVDVG